MSDWQVVGVLMQDEQGHFKFVKMDQDKVVPSGVVTTPTPEEARIAEEKEVDYSVEGRLKKVITQ